MTRDVEFDAGSKFEPTPQRSLDRRGGARGGSHGCATWLRDPQDRANLIERAPGGLQRLDLEQPVEVLRTVVASASDAQRHRQQPLLDVVPDGAARDVTEVGQLLNRVVLSVGHILNIHSQLSYYNCYISEGWLVSRTDACEPDATLFTAAVLFLTDPAFALHAHEHLDRQCPVTPPEVLDHWTRHKWTGPATPIQRSAKNAAALVATLRESPVLASLLAHDIDESDGIATGWLARLRERFEEAGLPLPGR